METPSVYIPMDRRQALARGESLPERTHGAGLFADISGFTPLTEALALELGPKRGAEELTHHLNRVFDALIAELHRYGGSVISFSGDAITCWLDGDDGSRATACALAMQGAMQQFATVTTASGRTVSLGMKVAVAIGSVRRFLVGDPDYCIIDAMAGTTLERLAAAEHQAERGDVILASDTANALGDKLEILAWREDEESGERFAVVAGLRGEVPDSPWPPLSPDALSDEQARGWLLPPVYDRLHQGKGEFLAELRPALALFLRFGGIEYDQDPAAADKLDGLICQVEDILGRYDGSLLQLTIGDKGSYLYAAFGAPVAHEDDAVRAASAALELQAMGAGLDYLAGFQIGITQGRMRTGAYGGRTRRTYGVMGDAVNLSARLMTAAEPGQILVSNQARAATGDTFIWENLPAVKVKGKSDPVPLARLVGVREQGAIRLLEPSYALPMVGRERELALIESKLEQALTGKGQIVGITAEAGMGKSRLAAEVIGLAREHGLVGYGGECQSYGTNTSYLVWRGIWRGFFGLDAAGSLYEQIGTLEVQLKEIDPSLLPRLPLLGSVLNLPIPDNDLTRSLDAKLRKSSLEALLVDCLGGQAQEHPILLVLEDCHWLDPLSHDLIEFIGRSIVGLPVLMLLVYRPPDAQRLQAPRVSQLPHFTEVPLSEFTPQEAERLIGLKLGQFFGPEADVPPGFVAQITERAAGNPFYIEELLNYLQDRDIHPQDAEALAALDLPASLYSLILSRMDQLTESQQITIKVASVIGRLFQAAMVWGVYPELGTLDGIKADLDTLSHLDLTPIDEPEPELTYLFRHIITQEVAYESLLYATRAALHDQIGQYIEEVHVDELDQFVNLLAYHYEHSENETKKREYLLKAGEAAQANYANVAAIDYFQKVLPLLPDHERATVLLKLGKVLELIGQFEAAGERYGQALALAEALGDRQTQAWCETATAELLRLQGQFSQASEWLTRARAGFEGAGDLAGVAQVLRTWGILASQQGDLEAARARYEEGLAIRRQLGHKRPIGRLLINLGIVARRQGNLELARSLYEESIAVYREINDRWGLAVTLINMGNLALDQDRYDEARSRLEEAIALHREVGNRHMLGNALNNLGNVARAQKRYEEAWALYSESLRIYRTLGDKWALAYLFEDVGSLAAQQGEAERPLRLVAAASVLREEIGAPLSSTEASKLESALEPARAALDKAMQASAWDAGRALSLEQAIEEALAEPAG